MLEILGASAAAVQPGEGPLDDPSARQEGEAFALSEGLTISNLNLLTFFSAAFSFGPP
jgi:hypothetical protein